MPEGYNGLPPYYVQSSDPITPNLLLSLIGMDPIVAENFVLIDAFAGLVPPSTVIEINGVPIASPINFNNTTPAAPGGDLNVIFQVSGSKVSAYVPVSGVGTVTSFSSGNLSPLFTTSVANPNSTPALSFSLSNAAQNAVFIGPVSGGPGAPTFRSIVAADLPATFETWAGLTGDLTTNQVVPWDGPTPGTPDTGISRIGVGELGIGNGTTGDISGSLALFFVNLSQPGGTLTAQVVDVFGTGVNGGLIIGGSVTDISNSIGVTGQALISNGAGGVVWATPTMPWNNLLGATGNLAIANTNHTTTFSQTSAIIWLWSNITIASAITTNASPIHEFQANYWNGTSSLADDWKLNSILGAGTNGTSTFQFLHTGSTGVATVQVPNLINLGIESVGAVGGVSGQVTLLGATSGSTVLASGATGGTTITSSAGISIEAAAANLILQGIGGTNYVQQFTTYVHYGSGIAIGWTSTTATGNTADTGISRIAAGVVGFGNGTAASITGNLQYNRTNIAGADQAGTATITAAGTSVVVNYAANYTGTAAPVVVVTPTSDPLALGVPVGYWVVANGGAGAWTGFTLNIQTALAGNITFNYIVMGKA